MRGLVVAAAFLIAPSQAAAEASAVCATFPKAHGGPRVESANTALVRRFHDAINRQDWRAADAMVGSGYRHYLPSADGFRAINWDAFKRGNKHLRTAFPDWRNTLVQTIAERDKVAVIIEGFGTHRGSMAGEKATGRSARLPIIIVHQVCNSKLISDWETVDTGPFMAALKVP